MIADLTKSSKAPLKKLILVALLLGMMVMMLVPNAFVVSSKLLQAYHSNGVQQLHDPRARKLVFQQDTLNTVRTISIGAASESSLAIADLNADDTPDFIIGDEDGKLHVLDSLTGNEVWTHATNGTIRGAPSLADLNDDAIPDVIITSRDGKIKALDGKNGEPIWEHVTATPLDTTAVTRDLNGDGKKEIIVGTPDGKILVLHRENGSILWEANGFGDIRSTPAIGDVNGDNIPDVIFGSRDDKIRALNGVNGSFLWEVPIDDWVDASPVLVDVNGDSILDVVIGSHDRTLRALNGTNGTIIWSLTFTNWIISDVAIGDVNQDNSLEIITVSIDGLVKAINASNGQTLWTVNVNEQVLSAPSIFDADGDNDSDIVLIDESGVIHAMEGTNGTLLWTHYSGLSSIKTGIIPWNVVRLDTNKELVVLSPSGIIRVLHGATLGFLTYWIGGSGSLDFSRTKNMNDVDVDRDFLSNADEKILGTSQTNADTDDDLIPDGLEVFYGLNPNNAADASQDVDQDGLTTRQEISIGTDFENPDTDNDEMDDGWEYKYGLNPLDETDASLDLDDDGLPNIIEYRINTDPNNADTDDDGLSDGEELKLGFDPLDPDSDDDGILDGQENLNPSFPSINFRFLLFILLIGGSVLVFTFLMLRFRSRDSKFPSIGDSTPITTPRSQILAMLLQGAGVPFDRLPSDVLNEDLTQLGFNLRSFLSKKAPESLKEFWIAFDAQKRQVLLVKKVITCQLCGGASITLESDGERFVRCLQCGRDTCAGHYVDLATIKSPQCPNCDGRLILLPIRCNGCGFDITLPEQVSNDLSRCRHCGYRLPSQQALHETLMRQQQESLALKSRVTITEKDEKAKGTKLA